MFNTDKDKRIIQIHFRLTADEYERFIVAKETSQTKNLHEFIFHCCVEDSKRIKRTFPPRKEIAELRVELARHGANLNQISRSSNAIVKEMTHMGEEELDADFGKVLADLAWLKLSLGEAYREVSDAFADCR